MKDSQNRRREMLVRDDLEAISRTAKAMALDSPGIENKFRMPRADNDLQLLAAARAFAEDAAPLSSQFIAHELPTDFLTDLNDDINAFEAAMSSQSEAIGEHVAARASIDKAIDDGMVHVRKFDAIVRNKYANDPATLAEWSSASHVERAPKRKAAPAPATPMPPASH